MAIALLFVSCKEEYFDSNTITAYNNLVLNGNEFIQTEKYYGDDLGALYMYSIYKSSNDKIYFGASKYIDWQHAELGLYVIGELDINGNILWKCEQSGIFANGFAEDDEHNIYLFGTNQQQNKSVIGKIENQSVKIIYINEDNTNTGFWDFKYIGDNRFIYVGTVPSSTCSTCSIGGIGIFSVIQDKLELLTFFHPQYIFHKIYDWKKTADNTYQIVSDCYFGDHQWGIFKAELTNDGFYDIWDSEPIITDNNPNSYLTSEPSLLGSVSVKNGNDLVVVGYGDNADGRTGSNVNSLISRGLVVCLDESTGTIKWKQIIPNANPQIMTTQAKQIFLHNNKYYVVGSYDRYYHTYKRTFGYGFVQTISLSGDLLDCYLFGKEVESNYFVNSCIVGNQLLMVGMGGYKYSSTNEYNDLFVPYDGYKGWFVSVNINDL